MIFQINLISNTNFGSYNTEIGTDGVNLIRNTLKVSGLNISVMESKYKINKKLGNILYGYLITIPEEIAFNCDLFQNKNIVEITSNKNVINNFLCKKVFSEQDEKTGTIKKAWIEYNLDEDLFLNNWINNNYPTTIN